MQKTAEHGQLTYTKDNPFTTVLLENSKLNKPGSSKDTRHFNISLKGSGIEYLPGDSLYVFPENEPEMVEELLGLLDQSKSIDEEMQRFGKAVNITRPSNKLFKLLEDKSGGKLDAKTLPERFTGYSSLGILKAVMQEVPGLRLSSDELADNSSMLQARAYSIASSLKAHPEEVQLCIARVDEEVNGQKILGVCSNYLSSRVPLNTKVVRIYLHVNDRFRLPKDCKTDIIMVGPGTGIAPFRAFIEERNWQREQGMPVGKDWLFFGDQRANFDFIYGDELESYKNKYGLKISTAFSRDQAEKVYVQNRMLESAKEIFEALEKGAHFYVCGDARRMAKDVDLALREIVKQHGKDPDAYMQALKDSKRYSRDVY